MSWEKKTLRSVSATVWLAIVLAVLPASSWALVEYGNDSAGGIRIGGAKEIGGDLERPGAASSTTSLRSGPGPKGETRFIEASTTYDFFRTDAPVPTKVERVNFNASLKVRQDLAFDLSYWQGRLEGGGGLTAADEKPGRWYGGNPKIVVNVNWLKFGKDEESTNVDIFGGVVMGVRRSPLASSRTDKLVGLETSKRFSRIILAIRGEFRPTGRPAEASELEIGNMQSFGVGLGWMVSNDIRLSLESETHQIKKGNGGNGLSDDFVFSTLAPKLYLGLSSYAELQMGMVVRTRSGGNEEEALKSRLFEFPGAFGNTFLLGLNFSV